MALEGVTDHSWWDSLKPHKKGLEMSDFWAWLLFQSCILWWHCFFRRMSLFTSCLWFQVMLWYIKLCLAMAGYNVLRWSRSFCLDKWTLFLLCTYSDLKWLKCCWGKSLVFFFLVFSVYFWMKACFIRYFSWDLGDRRMMLFKIDALVFFFFFFWKDGNMDVRLTTLRNTKYVFKF